MIGREDTKNYKRSGSLYNNEAIATMALGYCLNVMRVISIPKVMLVLPFVLHEPTAKKLRNISLKRSLEEFILKNPDIVIGFNSRYLDFLPLSVNAVTILQELQLINIDREYIYFNSSSNFYPQYEKHLGNRMSSIFKSIENLAAILSESDVNTFYLNLKVEI